MQSDASTSPSPDPSPAGTRGARPGRVLATDVLSDMLHEQIPPGEQVLAGDPTAAATTLGEVGGSGGAGGAEVGVWEMTPGTATDTEADEVFVVLAGRATLTFGDGDGETETLELGPGMVGRLHDGERTTWTVHETIRKVYITPSTPMA